MTNKVSEILNEEDIVSTIHLHDMDDALSLRNTRFQPLNNRLKAVTGLKLLDKSHAIVYLRSIESAYQASSEGSKLVIRLQRAGGRCEPAPGVG